MKITFFKNGKLYLSLFLILTTLTFTETLIYTNPSFCANSEADSEDNSETIPEDSYETHPDSYYEAELNEGNDIVDLNNTDEPQAPGDKSKPTATARPKNTTSPSTDAKNTSGTKLGQNSKATGAVKDTQSKVSTNLTDKMTIVMAPRNPFMTINGVMMEIDPPGRGTTPIIEHGRTLIPISAIVSVLGGDTSWNAETKSITVALNNQNIEFGINKRNAIVNGVNKALDVAPRISNQRTLVPIRFLVESCNVQIEYKNKKIIIIANYLPEGIKRAKNLFDSSSEIENFSKLPTIINTLTRGF